MNFTSDHLQREECPAYHFGNCGVGTRERRSVSEVFHKLLKVCDARAERDLDKTLKKFSQSQICTQNMLSRLIAWAEVQIS